MLEWQQQAMQIETPQMTQHSTATTWKRRQNMRNHIKSRIMIFYEKIWEVSATNSSWHKIQIRKIYQDIDFIGGNNLETEQNMEQHDMCYL